MKKHLALILAIAFCGLLSAAEKRIYQCGFQPEELAGWKIPAAVAQVEPIDGAPTLHFTVSSSEKNPRHLATRQLNLVPYRGKRLFLTSEVKGVNISIPPNSWNGAKLMFHIKTPSREIWPGAGIPRGSFDWTTVSASAAIPLDATTGTIHIGLEESSGDVWFRNLRITVEQPLFNLPPGFKAAYTDRVREMPRLRGVMSPNSFKPEDMEELKRWNANLIRWQIKGNWDQANSPDLDEYLRWFNRKLEEIDQVLDKCGKLGIKVLLDLHTPPGGRDETDNTVMFYRKEYRDAFYTMWEEMAKRYKDNPAVWGYDLVNEPIQKRPTEDGYLSVQYEAAKRIRAIDPETPIIIESNLMSAPDTFVILQPLPLPNIIYQAHMYWPVAFTHQGIQIHPPKPVVYPGVIEGTFCDRKQLKRYLEPVRQFEKKYGAKIYIGEFSAVRFASGAEQYLDDVISIFEEYNWDWCYHAFRESHFWSVELDADGKPAETARKKVLLKYFSRNQ